MSSENTTRYDPTRGDKPEILLTHKPDLSHPLVLYRGTSKKAALDIGLINEDGSLRELKLSSREKCDFSRGVNSGLYLTHTKKLAEFYADQAAEYDHSDRLLITAKLDPSAEGVKLHAFTSDDASLEEWRECLKYGWKKSEVKPDCLKNNNVIAGWSQTTADKTYWPAKSELPVGSKTYELYWQIAITSQEIVDGLTEKAVENLGKFP